MEDATNPESYFDRGVNNVRYYMQKKEYIFISLTPYWCEANVYAAQNGEAVFYWCLIENL